MGIRLPNSTDYIHPDESNLLELHRAMEYNTKGEPVIRVNRTLAGTSYVPEGNLDAGYDAFGRMRISTEETLFDNAFRYGDNTLEWNHSTSGSVTVEHLEEESSMALTVGTTTGDSIVRETKRVFLYQPGKSLLVLNTFTMAPQQTGLTQRIGYFGAENGFYVEQADDTVYMVKRSFVSSAVVNTRIAQSEWNVDKMNGEGPSGVTLDITKAQILWMDIEWLGVGSARMGFVINGQFVVCHIFHHANIATSVYMTTATLPIRYEIFNTGTTATAATLQQICSTVISEGGYNPKVIPRAVGNSSVGKNLSNLDNTPVPLVSIRLRADRLDAVAIPRTVSMYGLQNAGFRYRLIQHGTLTGASWTQFSSESHVQYDLSATAMTGGTTLDEGAFAGGPTGGAVNINLREVFDNSLQLRRRLDGTAEIFTLAAIATTNNDDAVGVIAWSELN